MTTETIQKDTKTDSPERETASARAKASDNRATEGAPDAAPQRTVSVTEAKKYRKRAQHAEQSLTELQQQLEQKNQRLAELEQIVTDLERRSAIDQLLIEAEAVDLESARLLTEMAVQQMNEPDVSEAVAELRRTKPFLFRASPNGASHMSARIEPSSSAGDAAEHAAAEAHATGNRNDLLRYLRLRRKRQ